MGMIIVSIETEVTTVAAPPGIIGNKENVYITASPYRNVLL